MVSGTRSISFPYYLFDFPPAGRLYLQMGQYLYCCLNSFVQFAYLA